MDNLPSESVEYVNCDSCNSNNYKVVLQIQDYRDGASGNFRIVKCNFCGLLYTNPRLTRPALIKTCQAYFTSSDKGQGKLILSLRRFIRRHSGLRVLWHYLMGEYLGEVLTKSRGRLLDIGCGFGEMLEDLRLRGCDVYGLELNPLAVKICRAKGLNVSCGTLEEIHFTDEFFDTVILWHVIEHLPSPKSTLKEVYRILKPGGQAFVYCPNADSYFYTLFGRYWHGLAIPMHFYHFTVKTIQRLIELNGFRIKKIRTVTPEYFFSGSLGAYIRNNPHRVLEFIQETGLGHSLFFRFFIASLARVLDRCLIGKGECLRVEFIKPIGKVN